MCIKTIYAAPLNPVCQTSIPQDGIAVSAQNAALVTVKNKLHFGVDIHSSGNFDKIGFHCFRCGIHRATCELAELLNMAYIPSIALLKVNRYRDRE